MSGDKLKILNLPNPFNHHTCQGDDIMLEAPICKVTWPFNQVVLEGHVTNLMRIFPLVNNLLVLN